jgi:hypothetical protein
VEILISYSNKLDHLAESYERLEHQENLVSCLSLKYELLQFAGRKEDAEAAAKKINGIIETYEMNGLKR